MAATRHITTVTCADTTGIISAVTGIISSHFANIVDADQHSEAGRFTARFAYDTDRPEQIAAAIGEWAANGGVDVRSWAAATRRRIVVCGSSETHCVDDLCARWTRGELHADLVGIVSDREQLRSTARRWGLPFTHLPVGDDRGAQEDLLAGELRRLHADLVVLARYMRVLPAWICDEWAGAMINIHHSTLPAFIGANPHGRAHTRGVKLIGATAHYVTAELDAGPIIAQDVVGVSHRDTVDDLRRRGRDVECTTLARAVRLHLDGRVSVIDGRCVVFE